MVIFNSYVKLPEGSHSIVIVKMPKVNISPVEDHVKSVAKTAFQKVPSDKLVVGPRDMEKRDLQN